MPMKMDMEPGCDHVNTITVLRVVLTWGEGKDRNEEEEEQLNELSESAS